MQFGIGEPVRRVEDARFLAGRGRYVDDIAVAKLCHGVVVASPHAHARLRRIDVARAKAAPGVLCVLTGADARADGLGGLVPYFPPEDFGGPKSYRTYWLPLAHDRVRCVGDRVAFVVAETLAQARDAAELIEVDYEPLPAVTEVGDAARPDAPRIYEDCPGNLCFAFAAGDQAATEAAFAKAKHIVSLTVRSQRLSPNSMEPRGAIGIYDPADELYTLYTSSQNPHGARSLLARAVFDVPETRIRVVSPDVGGGFGMKANPYPEDALVLWAARRCGRPVKWISTRSEGLMGDNHGRDQVAKGAIAFDAEGRMLAIKVEAWHAMGAYFQSAGASPVMTASRMITGVYLVDAVHVAAKAIFTNTSPMGVYRGAGRPEANYLVERILDRAAGALGLDPVELRRRNLVRGTAMPHRTAMGLVYDSGDFPRALDQCLALADWSGFAARRAASEARGRLRGRAVGCYIERGGAHDDRMELRFDPSGSVTILAGTFSHGQGHATTYAQMVCDWLRVPFQSIRFIQGDTNEVAFGRGTYAARSSLVGGCALKLAADEVIEKARAWAGLLLEAAPADVAFEDGLFRIAGTDRSMAMVDVAKASFRPGARPSSLGIGLEAAASYAAEPPNYPNGVHIAEVEVDRDTGAVTLARYAVIDDIGRVINPMIAEGQVHGALAQGIGQALLEEVVYDRHSGQLLTGSFADYTMPRADDFPNFEVAFLELPAATNPLGIKGVGETGTVAAPATIVNAVLDALKPLGVTDIDTPTTPQRVWQAIERARRGTAKGD
jgi:aerobic carbon-monoxide dehydrogenase large subunit